MVDINETEGLKWLTSLRDEYSADAVSFTQVDVSVTKQLVRTHHRHDCHIITVTIIHIVIIITVRCRRRPNYIPHRKF